MTIKPSYVTKSYEGQQGDREFVIACKGRPFSVLTSPTFPIPSSTLVDYNLVRDLKLRMTDLQCTKLRYGGQRLRILGKVSTSAQCISRDGVQSGNIHFKGVVVQDLYQIFDTHSIAGKTLSEKLIGPPYEMMTEDSSAKIKTEEKNKSTSEPTKEKKKKKAKVSKICPDDSNSECDSLPPSPRPVCQGMWIHHQTYHGWDSVHFNAVSGEIKDRWENTETGQVTWKKPASWDPEGSTYFYPSSDDDLADTADEYHDVYSNVSTVRFNPELAKAVNLSENQDKFSHNTPTPPDSSTAGDWILPVQGPPDSLGPASAKLFTKAQLAKRKKLFRSGQSTPPAFRHIPVPHGADWCDGDCPEEGQDHLPPECGYHPRFGNVSSCSARCPGGWCQHTRQMSGGTTCPRNTGRR